MQGAAAVDEDAKKVVHAAGGRRRWPHEEDEVDDGKGSEAPVKHMMKVPTNVVPRFVDRLGSHGLCVPSRWAWRPAFWVLGPPTPLR
jgi:hypothetical protein